MIIPLPVEEKKLLDLLASGDRKAFEQLYHIHKKRIYNNLLKLLRSRELAEELLQDVFYKLWLYRERLGSVENFPGYLNRIAANLVADFFRRAALDKKLEEQLILSMTELYNDIEEHMNFKDSSQLWQEAIEALPPQRQTIYKLCKVEGKSYEEVSSILGISTSTINDHMVKATRSIKKQFLHSREALAIAISVIFLHH